VVEKVMTMCWLGYDHDNQGWGSETNLMWMDQLKVRCRIVY